MEYTYWKGKKKQRKKTREPDCCGNIWPPRHENGFGAVKSNTVFISPLDGWTKL